MHFEENQYQCGNCGEEFRWRYAVEKHQKEGCERNNLVVKCTKPIDYNEVRVALGLK